MPVLPSKTASLPVSDSSKSQARISNRISLLLDRLAARLESSTVDGGSSKHLHGAGIREEIQALRNLIERNVFQDNEKLVNLRNDVIASIGRKKAQMGGERPKAETKIRDTMDTTDENGGHSWNDEEWLAWESRNEEHNKWLSNHKTESDIGNEAFRQTDGLEIDPAKPPALKMQPALNNVATTTPRKQRQQPRKQRQHPPAPDEEDSTGFMQSPTDIHQIPVPLQEASAAFQQPPTPVRQTAVVQTPPTIKNISPGKLDVLGELIVVNGENDQQFLTKLVEAVQKEKYDVTAAAKSIEKASTSTQILAGATEKSSMTTFRIPTPTAHARPPSRPIEMDMTDRAEQSTPGGLDTFMDAFNSNRLNYLKDPKNDKAKLLDGFGKARATPLKDSDGFRVPTPVYESPVASNVPDTIHGFVGHNYGQEQHPRFRQSVTDKRNLRGPASASCQTNSQAQPAFSAPTKEDNGNEHNVGRSRSPLPSRQAQARRYHSVSRPEAKKDDKKRRRRSRSSLKAIDDKGNKHIRDDRRLRSQSRDTSYHTSQNSMDGRGRSKSRGPCHQGDWNNYKGHRHRSQSHSKGDQGAGRKKSANHYANYSVNPNNHDLKQKNRENREFTPDFTKHVSEWGRHSEDKGSPQWGKVDQGHTS